MPQKKSAAPFDPVDALLQAFAINSRINEYLLRSLPAPAWRLKPPGGKGRDVASIVAHIHNVRLMWLKAAGIPPDTIPAKLEGEACTQDDASSALQTSYEALHALLETALRSDGRIKGFKPDAAAFIGYLIAHDAHHRGQISMLARQLGHGLPQSAMFGMWEWGVR